MSSSGIDISQLSDSEKSALETYTAVTGQEPSEAIPLLRRSQWNVQVRHPI
jgi:FAS-associated factor 2